MSRYETYLIKAGLIYLVLTGFLGVLFFFIPALSVYFRTTHLHLGIIGFFLSMVMGVAYWMMPRPGGLRQERLEAITFYLLNSGMILRLVAEPLWRYSSNEGFRILSAASGLLQFAAMLVFAIAMWQRVRTKEYILALRLKQQTTQER